MQTNSTPKDVLSYVGNGMNKKMWWAFVLFFYTAPLIGAIILDVDVSVVTLIICAAIDLFMWKLIMRSIKRLNVEIEYNSRLLNGPESDAIVKDFDTAFRYFNDTLRLGKKYVFGRGCTRIIRYSEIAEAYWRHRRHGRPKLECKLVGNAESMGQDEYIIGTIGTVGEYWFDFRYEYEEKHNNEFAAACTRLTWINPRINISKMHFSGDL